MLAQQQGLVYAQSLASFWGGLWSWLPAVLLAIIFFIVGIIIAVWVGKAVKHLIHLTKLDMYFDKTSVRAMLNNAGFHFSIAGLIGGLVKWLIIIGLLFGVFANIPGLDTVSMFLSQIAMVFLPRVLVAVLILVVGSVLADWASKLISSSAKLASVSTANFVGSVTKWAIWIATIMVALDKMGIGSDLIQMVMTGLVFALALAFGLSFGLGGRDAAARAIDRAGDMIKK